MQKFFLALILIFTMYCHVFQVTVFPFSNYPMYSKLIDNENKPIGNKIVGLSADGEEKEMSISTFAKPFWSLGLQDSITSEDNPEKIKSKMISALKFYNKNASEEKRFVGIRLLAVDLDWSHVNSDVDSHKKFTEKVIYNKRILHEIKL